MGKLTSGMSSAEQFNMAEKEVNNGRLAMLAVTAYVVEEAITGKPITELTPWLFQPAYAFPAVRQFLDGYFEVASAAQRISGDEVARFFDQGKSQARLGRPRRRLRRTTKNPTWEHFFTPTNKQISRKVSEERSEPGRRSTPGWSSSEGSFLFLCT